MRLVRILPLPLLGAGMLGVVLAAPPAPAPPTAATAVAALPGIRLSPVMPPDVTATGSTLAALQPGFDVFSWNSFIAVSWPPGPGGEGDPKQRPGGGPAGDNPTVWEGWRSAPDVFLPGGKAPTWDGPVEVPAACKAQYQPGLKVLQQVGKTPDVLTATTQAFNTGPLVDQNRAYTRFQVVVNRGMFDYILGNTLYSKSGQQVFTPRVKFPCGGGGNQVGAVMIKAAWKVIGKHDDASRFHTAPALVYTPPLANPPVKESCTRQTVGLVGLHIGHKVNSAPQWVWSTFEQVDNVPTQADVKGGRLAPHYNYFDPACKGCPVNTAPPRPWIPNAGTSPPTQVVRADVLPDFAAPSAAAQNRIAQALLRQVSPKSVWQSYELISTQWPTDPGPGACTASATDPRGNPAPQFLANTVIETYVQGSVPKVSSSCIDCHGDAAMTTGAAADFTYLLQRAHRP